MILMILTSMKFGEIGVEPLIGFAGWGWTVGVVLHRFTRHLRIKPGSRMARRSSGLNGSASGGWCSVLGISLHHDPNRI